MPPTPDPAAAAAAAPGGDAVNEVEERTVAPECIQWVKERLTLTGFEPEQWKDVHNETVRLYLASPRQISCIAWLDKQGELQMEMKVPANPPEQIAYYVKVIFFCCSSGAQTKGSVCGTGWDSDEGLLCAPRTRPRRSQWKISG